MAMIESRTTIHPVSLNRVLFSIKTRLDVWRTRRALSGLDAHQLKDIGISASAARREARMGFWEVPANWSCS